MIKTQPRYMNNIIDANQAPGKTGVILLLVTLLVILSGIFGPDWVSPVIKLLLIPVAIYFRNELLQNSSSFLPDIHKKTIFWSAVTALFVVTLFQLGMMYLVLG